VFLPPRISGARPLPPSDYSQCGGAIIRHAAAQVPPARTASRHAAAQDLSVSGGRVRKSPQCLKLYCYRCHKAILCLLEFTCRPFARPCNKKDFHCTVAHGPKLALRGVTSHLVTDMCMYSHAIVGVSPQDYGRAMAGYICLTHTVSVTYKLGVTAAG
jgi:hypothetical protein